MDDSNSENYRWVKKEGYIDFNTFPYFAFSSPAGGVKEGCVKKKKSEINGSSRGGKTQPLLRTPITRQNRFKLMRSQMQHISDGNKHLLRTVQRQKCILKKKKKR